MFVELVCKCASSMSVETDESHDAVWHLTWRFVNAHVQCNFVVPFQSIDTDEMTIVLSKDDDTDDEDEE